MKTYKVGIIGAGVMGNALARGLIESKYAKHSELWFGTRTNMSEAKKNQKTTITSNYDSLIASTKIIILCVKPKQMDLVLARLKKALKKGAIHSQPIIVSIAAGVTLNTLEHGLGPKARVFRAMPNTPVIVREGVTVVATGSKPTEKDRKEVQSVFEKVGHCHFTEETHFNALTGLGGSGPAYFYLIMESLIDGGVKVGLPRELAKAVILQTVVGSSKMVEITGRHPASLRDDVTTPAGCTIGALLTMEDGKIRSVLARAVEEATRIASKLGG